MKAPTLIIFIFLISFILPTNSSSPKPAILDTTGKNLRSGFNYHVMLAISGGGLSLTTTGNNSCSLSVAQSQPHKYGLPLTFTPVNPKKGVIRLSTDLNVKFSGDTYGGGCNDTNVWKVVYDEDVRRFAVKVGGVEGNPGRETVDNWFKVENSDENGYYKFVYCPNVCRFCKVLCRDLGIFVDEMGVKRLVLSGDPLLVMFYA